MLARTHFMSFAAHSALDSPNPSPPIQNVCVPNSTGFPARGRLSGRTDSTNRPAWAELITALHANGVRMILIEKLDRLARDLMIQETIIADLRKHGFELVSVAEPDLMANDPTRILVRQMMGAVAQYEKSQIVLKLRTDAEEGEGRAVRREAF